MHAYTHTNCDQLPELRLTASTTAKTPISAPKHQHKNSLVYFILYLYACVCVFAKSCHGRTARNDHAKDKQRKEKHISKKLQIVILYKYINAKKL